MPHAKHSPTPLFYLVLKGEIVIFKDKNGLRLLAPDLPEHAYVAGPWLAEIQLPKTRLQLRGAYGGCAKPSDFQDFLITLPNANPNLKLSRIDITVPFPITILPGALQDASNLEITITQNGTTGPLPQELKHTCLAAILVYEWDGKTAPFLIDPGSERQWNSGGTLPLYRSLNVYASGETQEQEADPHGSHAKQAFEGAAAVLGVCASIKLNGSSATTPSAPPLGLSYQETNATYFELLQLRQERGEIFEGGPLQVPARPSLRSISSGNCGPVCG